MKDYLNCPCSLDGKCTIKKRRLRQAQATDMRYKLDGRSLYHGKGFINEKGEYTPNEKLQNLANEINSETVKGGSVFSIDNGRKLKQYYDLGMNIYKDAQKYEGERHIPLWVNGGFKMSSYMGPKTEIFKRLEEGVEAVSFADLVSQLHDINYTLAQTSQNKQQQLNTVRTADELMINQLNRGKDLKLDNRLNIGLAKHGISTKIKLEDANIPYLSNKLKSISDDLTQYTPEQVTLLNESHEKVLNQINQQLQN